MTELKPSSLLNLPKTETHRALRFRDGTSLDDLIVGLENPTPLNRHDTFCRGLHVFELVFGGKWTPDCILTVEEYADRISKLNMTILSYHGIDLLFHRYMAPILRGRGGKIEEFKMSTTIVTDSTEYSGTSVFVNREDHESGAPYFHVHHPQFFNAVLLAALGTKLKHDFKMTGG